MGWENSRVPGAWTRNKLGARKRGNRKKRVARENRRPFVQNQVVGEIGGKKRQTSRRAVWCIGIGAH